MIVRAAPPVALLLTGLLLAGCSDDSARSFGFARSGPDEFTVTTRAPLSMPPDYALAPPRPGAPRPQEQSQTAQAEASLAPESAMGAVPTAGSTPGQAALVTQAGRAAPADIRGRVNAETPAGGGDRGFVDRLMFWRGSGAPPAGAVIDPQKEAERLRTNAALGKSPEDGATPVAQPPSKGWFDGLF